MKKNYKRGFSLAELLIALGIISIIATLGISIGKRGVERAFTKFFYAGYNGIYSVIMNANNDGTPMFEVDPIPNNICPASGFKEYLDLNLLETGNDVINDNNPLGEPITNFCQDASFRSTNGISVTIQKTRLVNNYAYTVVPMTIGVPAANNKRAYFEVFYIPSGGKLQGLIIPSSKEDKAKNIYNIQERADLLPFYLDDGLIGRVSKQKSGDSYIFVVYDKNRKPTPGWVPVGTEGAFTPFEYRSFKDAYCSGNQYNVNLTNIINCSGYSASEDGTIKPGNPKKIF